LFGTYSILTPGMIKLLGVNPRKAKRIVRPEQVRIKKIKKRIKASGQVTHVHFLGTHYEIELTVLKNKVIASVPKKIFSVDDIVHVTIRT